MVYPRYFFNIEILIVPFSTARWRSSRIRSENVPQRSLLLTTIPVVFSIPAPTISGSHNGLSKLVSCLAYGCWIISSSAMNRSARCWRRMNGIVTPGQEADPGGFASAAAPRGGVSPHTFPALSR